MLSDNGTVTKIRVDPPGEYGVSSTESEMDDEALLVAQIDEKVSRRILRGLCGEQTRREA
jgi:hypothetical protein